MRPTALLVLSLLLASTAAGCLGAQLAPSAVEVPVSLPRFDANLTLLERVELAVADGTKLVLAVNRTDFAAHGIAEEKLPVIVDIGPYFGTGIMEYTAIDKRLADYFVPRGYVVARASVRGTGESEGCFNLGGDIEQQDVVEIVEWLGTQPWSNGNVAVFGKSYDGTTPWMAAIHHAPHLKTIVPISGISDWYRYNFYDGTTYPEELAFQPYYYLYVGEDIGIPGPDGSDPAWAGNADTLQKSLATCQSEEFPEQTRADAQSIVTGDKADPFWIERDYEARIADVDVPVFMVHGLQDWNVKPDNEVPLWDALKGPKAMWLGQWGHDYPDINRYKSEWSRHDWNETLLTWFDHWLKGMDNDWEKLAHVEVQDQLGEWRTYETWPPKDAATLTLALNGDGALTETPGAASVAAFRDPLRMGYQTESGANGVAFLSGAMPEDVTILGRPFADVKLRVDQPGGNIAGQLFIVSPDGEWTEWDHGSRNLWHRESRDKGSLVTPGEAFNTTLWLYPAEITIPAGHRFAFALSAELPAWIVPSAFAPEYLVDIGDGGSTLTLMARAEDATALRLALDAAGAAPGGALGLPRTIVK